MVIFRWYLIQDLGDALAKIVSPLMPFIKSFYHSLTFSGFIKSKPLKLNSQNDPASCSHWEIMR